MGKNTFSPTGLTAPKQVVLIALVIKVHIRNCIDLPIRRDIYSCSKKYRNCEKILEKSGGLARVVYYMMLPAAQLENLDKFRGKGARIGTNYQVFCCLQMFGQNTYHKNSSLREVLPEKNSVQQKSRQKWKIQQKPHKHSV